MFCNQCGNEIPNETRFCPNCGAPVAAPAPEQPAAPAQPQEPVYAQPVQPQEPQYAQPVQQPAQPQEPVYAQPVQQPPYAQPEPAYAQPVPGNPDERDKAKSILIFGILAIAFACSYYVSFMGIVFGAITANKVKEYIAAYPLAGKAKVGSILGKVGLIVGIVFTVLSLITIIACTCSSCGSSSNYYGGYYY